MEAMKNSPTSKEFNPPTKPMCRKNLMEILLLTLSISRANCTCCRSYYRKPILGSRTRLERWFYLSNAPLSCIPYCVGNHSGIIIWFVFLVGIYASFFWIYIIWHFLSKIIIYILLSYLLDEMVVSKVNLRFIVLQAISWR